MNTTATWQHDMEFEITFPQGERLTLTSIPADARPGPGPTPMEAVQAALSACTGMDVVMILKKMRKQPSSLRIEVETTRRDAQPRIYTHMTLVYHLDGPELDAASAQRAVSLSQNKYCSVSAMLQPTVKLDFRIVLNGEPVETTD